MSTKAKSLIQRADAALADLTNNGGRLPEDVAERFIDEMYDSPTILKAATRRKMRAPSAAYPRLGLGGQILCGDPNGLDYEYDSVASGDRQKPVTAQVQLNAKLYKGQVNLPTTWIEDNIEQDGFQTHLMSHIAKQIALDTAKAAYHGDTALGAGTAALRLKRIQDGWFKRATSHVVDALGNNIDGSLYRKIVKAMPQKYLDANAAGYRLFAHRNIALDWRDQVSTRPGPLGDRALTEAAIPGYGGIPLIGDNTIEESASVSSALFCDPANLMVGVWREVTIKTWEDIENDCLKIVVTLRIAFNFIQPDAIVKVVNLKALD